MRGTGGQDAWVLARAGLRGAWALCLPRGPAGLGQRDLVAQGRRDTPCPGAQPCRRGTVLLPAAGVSPARARGCLPPAPGAPSQWVRTDLGVPSDSWGAEGPASRPGISAPMRPVREGRLWGDGDVALGHDGLATLAWPAMG